ncbi:MAG: acyl-CoA/acyl-ACP dehydrogenase [Proteobacteria bacterium]|nr:acyl-CoA/acyl-ACP dehydrogenase [Pseudomonadota bacterium]
MDYTLAKDQEMIRKSAKEFFEKECPKDKVRELKEDAKGYDPKTWKKMAELGYLGLVVPEKYGGMEGEFFELTVLMEEMGRNIVPSPFFTTSVLCAMPLMEFGTEEQKQAVLPGIAEKGDIWSFAQAEQATDHQASDIKLGAALDGDDYLLNGVKLFVPYASSAKHLLVVARTAEKENPEEGITLFMVDAKSQGLSVEVIPTSARDCRCQVTFDQVRVPKDKILGELDDGWKIVDSALQCAAVLKAAEMSGGAQAAHEIAINYAKERKQFGKAIGSFQGIQHRLAELLIQVEGLKYLVYEAAWSISSGTPSRKLNSMAKAMANAVYHDVCYHGIVIHGAIGWTEEMDIGLYHLRTKTNQFDGGGSDMHREIIAAELDDYVPDCQTMYS